MSKEKMHVYVVYDFGDADFEVEPRIIKVCASKYIARNVLAKYRAKAACDNCATVLKFTLAGVEKIFKGGNFDMIKVHRG